MVVSLFANSFLRIQKKQKKEVDVGSENIQKLKINFQEKDDESKKLFQNINESTSGTIFIEHYRIMMSYLKNSDSEKFSEIVEHLCSHDNSTLFEIVLTYKSVFKERKNFLRI